MADTAVVRRIFKLRAEGHSHRAIEAATGVTYSTVHGILKSRIYLGETLYRGEWFPGEHEPILADAEWEAAHRGHVPGRRRGRQLLSGRVRCGLCHRLAAVEYHPKGFGLFRCRHRGQGCPYPRRRASGLEAATLLGLQLIGRDTQLQDAIRRQLDGATASGGSRAGRLGQRTQTETAIADLERKRRKLLDLYYADGITAELFAEEERRFTAHLDVLRAEQDDQARTSEHEDNLAARFEEIVATLADLDMDTLWRKATDQEKRVLVEELVEEVAMFPDHLEVTVAGAPRLNVTLAEVGLAGVAEQSCERGDSNPQGL